MQATNSSEIEALITRLRKGAVCVYLAAEEGPAADLADMLTKAADLLTARETARPDWEAKYLELGKAVTGQPVQSGDMVVNLAAAHRQDSELLDSLDEDLKYEDGIRNKVAASEAALATAQLRIAELEGQK